MIKLTSKSARVCASCKFWNGGMGSPSLRVKPAGFIEVDNKDEETCYKTGFTRSALSSCHEYECRF